MTEIAYGTAVNVAGTFKNRTKALFDPTTVVIKIKKPSGTETSYTYGTDIAVVKTATGSYNMWFLPDAVGQWAARIVGTGPHAVALEKTFYITKSEFVTP